MFKHLSVLERIPTQGKSSLILNTPLQLPVAEADYWLFILLVFGLASVFGSASTMDGRLSRMFVLLRSTSCRATTPYSPSRSTNQEDACQAP